MKPIRELRQSLPFLPQVVNSHLKYFCENANIDFDVFLPSKGFNLQRDFVWTIEQKRELIWSILIKRNIPSLALINIITEDSGSDGIFQVIDGKQRLSAMFDFYNNKFTLLIDGKEYYYKDLPTDYQRAIGGYAFSYYLVNEEYNNKITDEQKIQWFMYINFAGTPQDKEHFEKLK